MGKMNANEYFESMGMNKVSAEHAVEAVRFAHSDVPTCHTLMSAMGTYRPNL